MKKSADRQAAALVEAGMVLASELDLHSLLQRIADLSREVVGAAYGAVGVLGDEGELVQFVYSGIDEETADKIGSLPAGVGILGALVEEQRPLRLRKISDHPRSYGFPKNHPPMNTFLGVPIVVRGRTYGRLYLTEKHDAQEFTKDDERIALTFAAQAGVAIDNARLYEALRERSEELSRAVSKLASVDYLSNLLLTKSPIEETMRSTAQEARKLTGATKATVNLLETRSGDMVIREAAGNLPRDLVGRHLRPGSSKAEAVMHRMTGEVVNDLATDTEMHRATIETLGEPNTAAYVPLVLHSEGIGALSVFDRTDGRPFSEDDLAVLQPLANQLAIAIENDRLTEALRDFAVLEERERISKELHDGVIQSIYSVGLSLQGSISILNRDPDNAKARINAVISELDNVVRDVRSYIFELRPSAVEEKGLEEAIAELLKDLEVNTLAHTTSELNPDACGSLTEAQQSHLIQVVREVLSNIARHAKADQVSLTCSLNGSDVVVEIRDNGIGFDAERVVFGQGLRNMRNRATRLGGTMEIDRRANGGTRHTLRFPRK
jgi:two-component system, NarL family, sensor histidine kinase DevS